MEQKRFTITITEHRNGNEDLEIKNQGFNEFELIGLLVHVTEQRKHKLNNLMNAPLEKEMD